MDMEHVHGERGVASVGTDKTAVHHDYATVL